ncbi:MULTISPECIES: leucyl/phenylalanyl-tRNA--protein transferase [Roseinatronobacter]|uniref:Leucyl/phenylalanyl-tRNA--protein transferase n=1 Tax=Roseinatronobacter domitianus TaxID=2940293 RepID=A0ABT0M050_9RHOB|nr:MULTISPECIES: leucyl/phenylalanyl-tRNA--protein transferase [Roseibaca]MCL1628245.1 leucyl/phenylalanyl-tRNA--protein transferase [Roseibaca domitiana]
MDLRLTPRILLEAYRLGTFPMAESREGRTLYWFDPVQRGIIPLDGFHLSRSLARHIRDMSWRVTLNTDFDGVIEGCAARDTTWINAEITDLFTALHRAGHAHSLEVWDGDDLIGGIYGLAIGGVFCGESMFSQRTNASKVAMAWLVTHLRRSGFTLFDTQYLNDHLARLGGVEIPRMDYRKRLADALKVKADITALKLPSVQEVMQLRTQRS